MKSKGTLRSYDINLIGTQVADILNPVNGYRGKLEREGKTPKNHVQINYRHLVKKQQDLKKREEERARCRAQSAKKDAMKLKKFQNVKSKINVPPPSKKQEINILGENAEENVSLNFIQRNKIHVSTPSRKLVRKTETKDVIDSMHEPGKLPKYLKAWKMREEKRREDEVFRATYGLCPSNMQLISEKEKNDTLRRLRKDLAAAKKEQSQLPLVIETNKMKIKQLAIEKKITQLEEGIKIFSRQKVYIPKSSKT
eukprot:snap_masked-scaffold_2-processed-gene-21.27-mRNA-1 protein AED:1.00 eAED:1.00 QI:0/0/0/0/1/1/2/0/253